jgi:hypothetical protein
MSSGLPGTATTSARAGTRPSVAKPAMSARLSAQGPRSQTRSCSSRTHSTASSVPAGPTSRPTFAMARRWCGLGSACTVMISTTRVGALTAAHDDGTAPRAVKAAFRRPLGEQLVRLGAGPGQFHLPGCARAVETLEPAGRIILGQRLGSQPVLAALVPDVCANAQVTVGCMRICEAPRSVRRQHEHRPLIRRRRETPRVRTGLPGLRGDPKWLRQGNRALRRAVPKL